MNQRSTPFSQNSPSGLQQQQQQPPRLAAAESTESISEYFHIDHMWRKISWVSDSTEMTCVNSSMSTTSADQESDDIQHEEYVNRDDETEVSYA